MKAIAESKWRIYDGLAYSVGFHRLYRNHLLPYCLVYQTSFSEQPVTGRKLSDRPSGCTGRFCAWQSQDRPRLRKSETRFALRIRRWQKRFTSYRKKADSSSVWRHVTAAHLLAYIKPPEYKKGEVMSQGY